MRRKSIAESLDHCNLYDLQNPDYRDVCLPASSNPLPIPATLCALRTLSLSAVE